MSWTELSKGYQREQGSRFLYKKGIKYKVINHEIDLLEQGRSIGIEIGETQTHVIYMPVNTDPQDKI